MKEKMTKVTQGKKSNKSVIFNFESTGKVHPAIKCLRGTSAFTHSAAGVLVSVATNTPRIDHDPLTRKCLGLLCEPASTNFIIHSSDFSQSVWSATGLTLEATNIDSPIPGIKATRVRSTAETNTHWLHQNKTRTNGARVTGSFLIKYEQGGAEWVCLDYGNYAYLSAYGKTYFNLITGEVTGRGCKIVRYQDGWWRVFINATIKSTIDTVVPEESAGVEGEAQEDSAVRNTSPRIRILKPGIEESHLGVTTDSLLLAHVQDENTEDGTSIIVTGASQVTRNIDQVYFDITGYESISGALKWSESIINPDNDFNANRRRNIINFSQAAVWDSRIMIYSINNTLYRITTEERTHTDVNLGKIHTGTHTYAFSYDGDSFAFRESVNGGAVSGNVQKISLNLLDRVVFGGQAGGVRGLLSLIHI